MRRILVAVTGASGSTYADRLIQCLTPQVERLYVVATDTARQVALHELPAAASTQELCLRNLLKNKIPETLQDKIKIFQNDNFFAPVASGSAAPTDMVIVPCSMGTLARIAGGISSNLIERSADVMLKQNLNLIMVPRESPLSRIHLENMLKLSTMNVKMVAAMPAFYSNPQSMVDLVDFVVGKVMEQLNLPHNLYPQWASDQI